MEGDDILIDFAKKNEPSSLAASSGYKMFWSFMCSKGAGEGRCLPESLNICLHTAKKDELVVKEILIVFLKSAADI